MYVSSMSYTVKIAYVIRCISSVSWMQMRCFMWWMWMWTLGVPMFLWTLSKKPLLSNHSRDRQTWQWKIHHKPSHSQRLFPAINLHFSCSNFACLPRLDLRRLLPKTRNGSRSQQGILAAVHLQHPRRAGCLTYGKCQNVPFWMDDSWWSTMILPKEKSDLMKFTTMFRGDFDHLTWA